MDFYNFDKRSPCTSWHDVDALLHTFAGFVGCLHGLDAKSSQLQTVECAGYRCSCTLMVLRAGKVRSLCCELRMLVLHRLHAV